jgi:hypothetical protein
VSIAIRVPTFFHADHIIARQHGGKSDLENLALACLHCNQHKGPNIAGRNPESDELVELFHPRRDRWSEIFNGTARTRWERQSLVAPRFRFSRLTIPAFVPSESR